MPRCRAAGRPPLLTGLDSRCGLQVKKGQASLHRGQQKRMILREIAREMSYTNDLSGVVDGRSAIENKIAVYRPDP